MMLKYFQDQAQAATRRYLSEGELLGEPGQNMLGGGSMVGPSSSAGHIQDLAGSPQRQLYYGHSQPGPQPTSDPASPLHSHSYAQQVRDILSSLGRERDRYCLLIGRDLSMILSTKLNRHLKI